MRKTLALLLAMILALTCLGSAVFAEEGTEQEAPVVETEISEEAEEVEDEVAAAEEGTDGEGADGEGTDGTEGTEGTEGQEGDANTDHYPHTYVKNEELSKAPTCTEDGLDVYICEVCLDRYEEVVPALGHDFDRAEVPSKVDPEPTCTEPGKITYAWPEDLNKDVCTRCHAKVVVEDVEPLGHDYKQTVKSEATCADDEVWTYTCERCGDTFDEVQPNTKLSHKLDGEWQVSLRTLDNEEYPSTCTEQGLAGTAYFCTLCNKILTDAEVKAYLTDIGEDVEKQEQHLYYTHVGDHGAYLDTLVTWAMEADLADYEDVEGIEVDDEGYLTKDGERFCKDFGEFAAEDGSYVYDAVTVKEDKQEQELEADCEQVTVVYGACDYTVVNEFCTTDGTLTVKCQECGVEKTYRTLMLGHDWDDGVYIDPVTGKNTASPDCTRDGVILFTCERCGEQFNMMLVTEKAHRWSTDPEEDAAELEENGKTWKYRQKKYFDEAVREYPWDEIAECYDYERNAPCLNPWCAAYKGWEAVEGDGQHDWENASNKIIQEPKCYETGLVVYHCANCDYPQSEILPMVDHKLGAWKVTKAATCEEDGVRTRKCTNKGCTYKETQAIPAVGHEPEVIIVKPGDCYTEQIEKVICKNCGKVLEEEHSVGFQHDTEGQEHYAEFPATCRENASYSAYCKICHKLVTVEIPGTMEEHREIHLYPNVEYVDATCTTDAKWRYVCSDAEDCDVEFGDPGCPKCGYKTEWVVEEGTALGHKLFNEDGETKNYVILKYPSCTETGLAAYTCWRCEENIGLNDDAMELPVLPHNYITTFNASKNAYELKCGKLKVADALKKDIYYPTETDVELMSNEEIARKGYFDYLKDHGYVWVPEIGCGEVVEIKVANPEYDIAVDLDNEVIAVSLKDDDIDQFTAPLKDVYVRVSWNYTLSDGESFTYIAPPMHVTSDFAYAGEVEFVMPDTPYGATYNGMTIIACSSSSIARSKDGADANQGYGIIVVKP